MTRVKLRHKTRYLRNRRVRITETETLIGKRGEAATIKATREVAFRTAEGFATRQFSVSDKSSQRHGIFTVTND